jgi:hypothetical protein
VEVIDGKAYATFVAEGAGRHTLTAGSKGSAATDELSSMFQFLFI